MNHNQRKVLGRSGGKQGARDKFAVVAQSTGLSADVLAKINSGAKVPGVPPHVINQAKTLLRNSARIGAPR